MRKLILTLLLLPITLLAVPVGFNQIDTLKYGLVGWWTFNEGSGNFTADSSGYGNTGGLSNSPAWHSGVIGGAISFNKDNSVTNTFCLTNLVAGTVACWVYNTENNISTIKELWGTPNISGYFTSQFYSDGNEYWGFNFSSDTRIIVPMTNGVFSTNSWMHYAYEWSNTGQQLFANGILVASSVTQPVYYSTNANFCIGKWTSSFAATGLQGFIDDFRIYNRALSAAEIKQLYNGGCGAP